MRTRIEKAKINETVRRPDVWRWASAKAKEGDLVSNTLAVADGSGKKP